VDLERWGDYMETNGVVFVISIIGVNVVQKLVSHFGHPLVEVIILNILLSVFLSNFCVSRWQGRSILNLWWPTSSTLSLDCSHVPPSYILFSSLISYPPHLPHIHLPPPQTMDQSQFLYHWEESELDHSDESPFGFYSILLFSYHI